MEIPKSKVEVDAKTAIRRAIKTAREHGLQIEDEDKLEAHFLSNLTHTLSKYYTILPFPKIGNPDLILRRYNVELEGPAIPVEDTPEVKAAAPMREPFRSVALAVVKGDTDATISKVKDALRTTKPLDIIEKGLAKGMDAVGALYASGTYFLPNVMVSADAMMAGIAECEKALGKATTKKGKVVCHVAEGDPHDIGKNLVMMFMGIL